MTTVKVIFCFFACRPYSVCIVYVFKKKSSLVSVKVILKTSERPVRRPLHLRSVGTYGSFLIFKDYFLERFLEDILARFLRFKPETMTFFSDCV